MGDIVPGRLRWAREYLGLTTDQIAGKLGWTVETLATLEGGATTITGEQLRKLSRLYRRPIPWFSGETRFEPGPRMLRMVEGLHEGDREAVLDFAEWLAGAGPPPKITRAGRAGHPGDA